ncbi:MAG: D-alanyl-D-alanine carboxypeptidase (penicillin-binding protein 5/6) [Halieaceae bacterium]|jgi:D-alanyl-D-alanine carboxypeptidase (penicillin-binding protein 5/6)
MLRTTSPSCIKTHAAALICTILLLGPSTLALAAPVKIPAPPQLSAKAYLLIDADSGKVIVEQNADDILAPASLTKMMTSYVLAHELHEGNVSNDDMVLISKNAWAQNPIFEGSSLMWIEVNKEVKLADLHRGIVISSGNDATVAVAEHIAGSESAFADLMNQHAVELGMSGTNFVNSHGLPHPDHYTTARDLATLANAIVYDYPEDYRLYQEREFTYNNIRQYNRNTLMGEDPSVDGLKTGHTNAAGYCLVASAKRQGMRLITVVLGTNSDQARKRDTRNLLSYGFRFFSTGEVVAAGTMVTESRVWKGESKQVYLGVTEAVILTLPRGQLDDIVREIVLDNIIEAPVATGQVLGKLVLKLDDEVVTEVPLVALAAVEEAGFFARLWDQLLLWLAQLLGTVQTIEP